MFTPQIQSGTLSCLDTSILLALTSRASSEKILQVFQTTWYLMWLKLLWANAKLFTSLATTTTPQMARAFATTSTSATLVLATLPHLNGWLVARELKSSTWVPALVARYLTLSRRSQRPVAKRFLTLLSLAAQVTLQLTTPIARKLPTCLAGRLSTTSPTCAAIPGSGSR